MKVALLISVLIAASSCATLGPTPIKSILNRSGRIIGGQPALPTADRFVVAIHAQSNNFQHFCGGTLVRDQWIITAAQCVYGATSFVVELGAHNLVNENPYRVKAATTTYTIHPQFNPTSYDHDIALIRLRNPVQLSDYIKSVEVIGEGYVEPVHVVGWGQTSESGSAYSDDLMTVPLSIITNDECKLTYGNQLTDSMLCASGNYNEGTCIGDMGSPLIGNYQNTTMSVLVGIASFISGNGCESTDPSGFTDIRAYEEWIYDIMNAAV